MKSVKKVRWFWSWNDQQEEQWLSSMSAQGLHLKEAETPFWYTFVEGAPADVVYRLDYYADTSMFTNQGWYALDDSNRKSIDEEKSDYQQLFEDAGWYYRGTNRGWRYLSRVATDGETTEIFTDTDSKVQKHRRQLLFQLAMLALVIVLIFLGGYDSMGTNVSVTLLSIAFIAAFAFPLLPILRRIRQLQREG